MKEQIDILIKALERLNARLDKLLPEELPTMTRAAAASYLGVKPATVNKYARAYPALQLARGEYSAAILREIKTKRRSKWTKKD